MHHTRPCSTPFTFTQGKNFFFPKLIIWKIMRKILGPIRLDDGRWRIKTNQEISDTLKGQNMSGLLKSKH
jgi:hypothetical protein